MQAIRASAGRRTIVIGADGDTVEITTGEVADPFTVSVADGIALRLAQAFHGVLEVDG